MTAERPAITIATVTLSDTRTTEDDSGGRLLVQLLSDAGFTVADHAIVREDLVAVRAAVRERAARADIDAVITTGGTGLGPRDVTLEAIDPLFEKTIVGFGEAFRRLSWDQIGPRAILSNAAAGLVAGRVVIALPGSPKAIELAIKELVAPTLRHALDVARGVAKHGASVAKPKP